MKPRSELNSTTIIRSTNLPDNDKSEVLKCAERALYTSAVVLCKSAISNLWLFWKKLAKICSTVVAKWLPTTALILSNRFIIRMTNSNQDRFTLKSQESVSYFEWQWRDFHRWSFFYSKKQSWCRRGKLHNEHVWLLLWTLWVEGNHSPTPCWQSSEKHDDSLLVVSSYDRHAQGNYSRIHDCWPYKVTWLVLWTV